MEKVITGLKELHSAYVKESFARGQENLVIDLLLAGNGIVKNYLIDF